jgi:DNA-binding SARP family transcriptional activator/tetratricopeptide (TPR) repeat protein
VNDPVLHVEMLGGFDLHYNGKAVPPISSRPASSLLAYLILRRHRTHTRDLLAGRFWSDLSEDKARRRLSDALWQIRRAVKTVGIDDLFEKSNTTVAVRPDLQVEVDVEGFEAELDAMERALRIDRGGVSIAQITRIVGLYGGELLAGHYDEWIDDQRDKLLPRYLAAVSTLVQLHRSAGDYEAALRHARALVAADPLTEEWHRDVMRLYLLNGQPSAAERQFSACRDALEEGLGVEPSPETVKLAERIRQEASTAAPISQELPFVGRAAERSLLLGRVNDVMEGKGGLVLVEGETGIGKSRLLAEMADGAEWRDVQVFVGRHSATSPMSPYDGLREALAPATHGLRGERLAAHLPPVWLKQASTVLEGLKAQLEPADARYHPALRPEEEPGRTTEALVRTILAMGQPKPALVVLEDVHRSDDDTVAVLARLGERLIDSSVLVCLSYQRHEAESSPHLWQMLSALESKPGSSRIVLGPLETDDVRQLVTAELGPGGIGAPGVGAEQISRLTMTSGGNPYVILELLRSPIDVLGRRGPGPDAVGDPGMVDDLLPGLLEVLTRRIDAVPAEVREVLEVVSAMTGPMSTTVVTGVAGLDRPTVVSALTEAVERGFLVETTRGCEFAQEHTRRVVYDGIEPASRRRIHGRIVDALVREQGVRVGQMAHHAWLAEQWHRAYQYHALAADSALKVNAYHTTAEHFAKADQAASESSTRDADRIDDLAAFERVLDILGRRSEQQTLLDRMAAAASTPEVRLQVDQRRAWLLANTDRGAEAARLALEAIAAARETGLSTGELLTIVGCARAWSGDLHGAIAPLEEAVAEIEARGGSGLTAQIMLGRTCADLLRYEPARQRLEAAYEVAKSCDDPRSQVEALSHLAPLYNSLRMEVKAENAFLEALQLARSIGYRHGEGLNLVNLATFHLRLGRGGRAIGLFAEAAAVFASLGNGRGEAWVRLNGAHLAHWVLGDDTAARSQAQQAAVYFRSAGDPRQEADCLIYLAGVDRRSGRRRLARRRLLDALSKAQLSDDPETEVSAQLGLALVALDLAHPEQALVHTEAASRRSREAGLEATLPVVMAVEGRARLATGQREAALEAVSRSVELNWQGAALAHLAAWWSCEVMAAAGEETGAAQQAALAHRLMTRNLEGLPDPVARAAWNGVSEHLAILRSQERYFVRTVECRLPRLDMPTGRPLEPGELVDVVWTVSLPGDSVAGSGSERRQVRILRLAGEALAQGAVARVSDLASVLGVSDRTIKRDLSRLRAQGRQLVTRGGHEEIRDLP